MDLVASAERIFYRYLSPAGNAVDATENHEIYLPPALRVHSFPLSSSHEPKTANEMSLMAQIPDMYHAQKEYCFRAMEQDAFPRFLRSKAFGNLTPVSAFTRLIAGLLILWIGLAAGFALIFLDVRPKSKRFFVRICVICWKASLVDVIFSFQLFIPSRLRYYSSSHTNTNSIRFWSSSVIPRRHLSARCGSGSHMSRSSCLDGPSGSACSSQSSSLRSRCYSGRCRAIDYD